MDVRSRSSRAVLLSLAIAAIAVAAALFGLSDPASESQANRPEESTASTRNVPRASLEATEESVPTRADAPEQEAQKASTPVGIRTLVVSGTVLEKGSRAAVPGTDVEAVAGLLPGDEESRARVQSDADGHYSLELVIPADLAWDPNVWAVRVIASSDRFDTVNARLRQADFQPHSTNPNASVAIHDIEIELLLAWRGRLVRESDGTPIADGTGELLVLAQAPTVPRSIARAETDDAGNFLIQMKSVEPGDLAVFGSADGFLAKIVPTLLDPAHTVDVGAIALGEGACLEGFVTTANGSAPAATRVYALTRARDDHWMYLRTGGWAVRNGVLVPRGAQVDIGPDGAFRLCGLAPDDYSLTVSYAGCMPWFSFEGLDVKAPASGVRILLSKAVYRLHVFDGQSGSELSRSRFLFDGPQAVDCNIEGDYVIATDPGIEYPGRIVAEGYRALKCTLPALAASEVRDLEFRLQPLLGQIACTILVTSPTGAPVEYVEVEIRCDAGEVAGQGPIPRLSHEAPDGRHDLPKLVPGTYHLEIEPRRQGDPAAEMWLAAALELHVREGMEPIEVRLVEGGLVQATVTKKGGESVDARTSLVRTPEGEPERIDWRNDGGTFLGWIPKQYVVRLAKPLPAGPWTLRFEADGCTSQDVVVNVNAGGTTAIMVSLEPSPPR